METTKTASSGRVKTKLTNKGWMVFVDKKEYLQNGTTLRVAESIADNARLIIDRGFENQLHFGQ